MKIFGLLLGLALLPAPASAEPAAELYEQALARTADSLAALKSGDFARAGETLEHAGYFLRRLREDFPDWRPAPTPPPQTGFVWGLAPVPPDFEPKIGEVFRLELEGKDRRALRLSWRRLKPGEEEARAAVLVSTGGGESLLVDENLPDLFRSDGSLTAEIMVPAGTSFFLVAYPSELSPKILSNILTIP